jgi:phosphoribulokinase
MRYSTSMTSTGGIDFSQVVEAIRSIQSSGTSISVGEVKAHDYHDFMEQMDSKIRRERLSGMHRRRG